MQFMITFNHVEGIWDGLSEEDKTAHNEWLRKFMSELAIEKDSKLVFLSPPDQRRTVRKQGNGHLVVSEGPAIPGPEQVGGYYMIEAETIDEAVVWAEKGRWLVGSNEVRQIFTS